MEFFCGACAVGAQGVLYPTCTGTFVVFQTDISAELLDRGHDNDRIITGPGYMSAAQDNGLISTCLY